MKNIVLFNPRASRYGNPLGAPLGLLSICRNINREKFNIKIYSSWIDKDYEERIIDDCKNAVCFGVTSMTGYQIVEGLNISKIVKKLFPDLPVIWGGYHPTILPLETVLNDNIDIVVRGQGEITFRELVNSLNDGKGYKHIEGITYKDNHQAISNPNREILDINFFNDLPYDLIDMKKYIHVSRIGAKTIEYVASFGCPFDCGFCVEPRVYNRKWSGLKAERVVNELDNLVKTYGIDCVQLQETNFFVDEQRVKNICQGLIERKIKISWGDANGRAPQLVNYDENTWEIMKLSGCKNILIGAESAFQKILDYLNKKASIDDTIKIADISAKHGISVTFSMMIGIPPDKKLMITPKQELDAILSLSRKIMTKSMAHVILIFTYTPYPGTRLFSKSIEMGYMAPDNLEKWGEVELHKQTTPWIKAKDIRLVNYLTNFVFRYVSNSGQEYISRQKNLLKKMYLSLMRFDACLRWKTNYFGLIWEYWLYTLIFKIRAKNIK